MSKSNTFRITLAAGALALAAAWLPASAAAVNQSLTLTADFGPVGPFSGSFAYDDATVPGSGAFKLTLSAFSIDLAGVPYALADTGDAFAVFQDGQFQGLQLTIAGVLTLSPAVGPSEASFFYSDGRSEAAGGASFDAIGTVPEPATAALALGALGLAAAAARRRRRR